jgi:hypothetical protein
MDWAKAHRITSIRILTFTLRSSIGTENRILVLYSISISLSTNNHPVDLFSRELLRASSVALVRESLENKYQASIYTIRAIPYTSSVAFRI